MKATMMKSYSESTTYGPVFNCLTVNNNKMFIIPHLGSNRWTKITKKITMVIKLDPALRCYHLEVWVYTKPIWARGLFIDNFVAKSEPS